MYRYRMIFALMTMLALLASGAWSQEARGSIAGKVSDQQGAVIPGASVTVTNVETNSIRRTRTNDTGYFEATLLNPGQILGGGRGSGLHARPPLRTRPQRRRTPGSGLPA